MGWFKVDDQLAFNTKIVIAGNAAMGLWVRAGSWSSAQLTGGFIPKAIANAMANECDADALVMAGLWREVEGGYQFHDWDEFQPSAEAEKEKRKRTSTIRSEAGKAGAQARWGKPDNGKTDGKRNSKSKASEWQNDSPDPTRPDPMEEAKASSVEIRDDVNQLCELLADLIESNGSKRPTIGKKWTDEARRMIDLDGREPSKAANLIRWSQADSFWRKNILSMPTFREKYDQLRLAALEVWEKNKTGPSPDGEIDPEAILGRDLWTPPAPPDDLPQHEYKAWLIRVRREHEQARYAEAQKRATA